MPLRLILRRALRRAPDPRDLRDHPGRSGDRGGADAPAADRRVALGAWLVKREGRRAWEALQETLETGQLPGQELADAALVLVGGTLLLTPGFVTDIFGFFFVLPFTRPLAREAALKPVRRVVARCTSLSPTGGGVHRHPQRRRRPPDLRATT